MDLISLCISRDVYQPLKGQTGEASNIGPLVTVCSVGKPWVLAFMRMPLDTHHQPTGGTWIRAQGGNLASKIPRAQTDQSSKGCAVTSLIHKDPIVDRTCLLSFTTRTQILCCFAPGRWRQILWVLWSARWCLHGSDLFWHVPQMLDWIGIWGICMPRQRLGSFVTFLEPFQRRFCVGAGCTALLVVVGCGGTWWFPAGDRIL